MKSLLIIQATMGQLYKESLTSVSQNRVLSYFQFT